MFSYIRWFSGASFLVVICAAFFLGHSFKQIASRDLEAVVNNNNISLAQGFINTTWRSYSDKMQEGQSWYYKFRSSSVSAGQWKNYNGYQQMIAALNLDNFSRSVFRYFEDMPIVEVSIYMTDGTRLITTNQSSITDSKGGGGVLSDTPVKASFEDGGFEKAVNGQVVSVSLEDHAFARPDGAVTKGTLIKTLVPVTKNSDVSIVVDCKQGGASKVSCGNGKATTKHVEAVIEVSYDITEEWKQLNLFQSIGTGGVIVIFIVVIATLLFTSNKAEFIIARQHETNVELAAQAASAQAENRDKSQFLANVSHELRTPLNAIIGFSEFIKSERSGPIGNEKYGEYIKDIHSSGVHLLSLINDILDYSKAEADKLELEISEVDATKSIKNSMRLVSPRAEVAHVQLLEEIPREHFIMKTDAKKLKQVMLNLLSNAVKFTPAGGSVTVTMWENVVDGSVSIEVRDTGIGIAPKDISRAMAPFGQVDNTLSRKYEGTGLGLPLTRKFVEIMGGSFNIQSEVGRGTVIVITLPKEMHNKNDRNGSASRPQPDKKTEFASVASGETLK